MQTRKVLRKLTFYVSYAWRCAVLHQAAPLFYGVCLTDRCNFSCRGCRVSNTDRPDMSWEQLTAVLRDAFARGFREIYFSGGEPMLWRDGRRSVDDAVAEARRIGFYHVHLYTNGTLGPRTSADLVWVSMDGLPGTFELRRGDHFREVERSIRARRWPKAAVIYVIDRNTQGGIERFLRWIRDSRLPVIGVMFYFHTPYYGRDEERRPVIDRLLACIGEGLPLLNSRAGLRALQSGNWTRRTPSARVADVDGEYICCRAPDDACSDCGYAACVEIVQCQRLRPSAMLAMRRYW
jgi:MoaA/NifB/PqqE/SkfB family radical SAM enzyme